MKKSLAVLVILLAVQAGSLALAQEKKLAFHVSGGASAPLTNQEFRDLYSSGPNGSLGLDVRVSPKLAVGAELGYSSFGLDRKGLLDLIEMEDDDAIKIKGGDLSVVEVLGVGKYYPKSVDANTGFYLLAGAGLSASSIAKLEVTTPAGDLESDAASESNFMALSGIGLQHKFGAKWNAYFEVRYTRVFSDEAFSYLPVRIGTTF